MKKNNSHTTIFLYTVLAILLSTLLILIIVWAIPKGKDSGCCQEDFPTPPQIPLPINKWVPWTGKKDENCQVGPMVKTCETCDEWAVKNTEKADRAASLLHVIQRWIDSNTIHNDTVSYFSWSIISYPNTGVGSYIDIYYTSKTSLSSGIFVDLYEDAKTHQVVYNDVPTHRLCTVQSQTLSTTFPYAAMARSLAGLNYQYMKDNVAWFSGINSHHFVVQNKSSGCRLVYEDAGLTCHDGNECHLDDSTYTCDPVRGCLYCLPGAEGCTNLKTCCEKCAVKNDSICQS